MTEAATRYGTAALVGRPNAGKSTLVNALVEDKVAIVSPRPQTTRNRIVGILNEERGQAVFLDLPGVHRPLHRMNTRMMRDVRSAMDEVDVVLHLVDASQAWGGGEEYLMELLSAVESPVIGLLNKVALVRPRERLLPMLEQYHAARPDSTVIPISALTGDGLAVLLGELFARFPEGAPLYPTDLTTTQTERFFVAEVVREKLLGQTRGELPYTTAVVVEQFEELDNLVRIDAVIYVERGGQKAIVIGRGGRTLKTIGQAAREELERWLGVRMYLALRVKVHPRWRDDPRILARLEPDPADFGIVSEPEDEP